MAGLVPAPCLGQALSYRGVQEINRIIAVVNDDVIVMSELEALVRTVRDELRASGARPPPIRVLERQVLDRLILERLQLQVAERLGVRVRDERLNRAVADIAQRNKVGLTEFRELLEREDMSFASFRERIRKEMIIAGVRQRQVGNRIRVRDQEIDRYLEIERAQGGSISEYRLSHILLTIPANAGPEDIAAREKLANDIVQKLHAGESFDALAAEFSDGGQAESAGDLGWRTPDKLPSLFAGIVPSMAKGDISEPLRSSSGLHIVRLTDVKGESKTLIHQTRPQHILIQTNELTSDEDARTRLLQLRERIIQGANFGDLARSHSDDRGSTIKDGDLGWVNPGDLVPEFERVMTGLDVGEVSAPFKSSFGWHIARVRERRHHDSTIELKRGLARAAIRDRRTNEELETWLAQLRDDAFIEYRLEE